MTRHTFGKAFATATAAVTTIALGATSAGAAQLGPAQFSGAAKAQTLQLSLQAPSELLGLLGASNQIDLGISLTEVTSSSAGDLSAATHLLTGLLNEGATSADAGDSYASGIIPATTIGPVSLGVGNHSYSIDRATNAVTSASELASVEVSVESLLSGNLAPAKDVLGQVDAVVDTVLGEADAVVGGIVSEINSIVDELETTLEEAAGLVLDIPAVNLSDLNVVRDVREQNILSVRKLWSETSVAPVGDKVRSSAESGIVGLSILDGIVEIPAWTFSAWAETAGTPGSAQWGGNTESLALNVLGNEIISLDGSVLTIGGEVELDLNDPALSGIVGEELGSELDALIGDLLDLTGLSIEQGRLTGEAAADGSFATATASAFTLSLAPLHAATALANVAGLSEALGSLGLSAAQDLFHLQIDLLPVTATANAAPAPAAPTPAAPNLPRTGGGAAAMALGLLGMGSAGLLRRRF